MRCLLFTLFSIILSCCNVPEYFQQQKKIIIQFPAKKENVQSFEYSVFYHEEHHYLPCIINKTELGLINIENNQYNKLFSLDSLAQARGNLKESYNIYLKSIDSIFVLPDETKAVYLMNKNGELINKWEIETPKSYNYVLSGFSTIPVNFEDNKLLIRIVPLISPYKQKAIYFNDPPDLMIDLTESAEISYSGGWPKNYLEENFYDSYPSRCVRIDGDKKEVVYSFSAEHDLYVYNYNNRNPEHRSAKSDFINNFELFPDDSIGNISFTMKYLITSPRYGMVYYDRFRKLFYRIAFHKTSYLNEDGETSKGAIDQPWSLVVLNQDYEKILEKKFDPNDYTYGPMIITKGGLLIRKRKDDDQLDTYQREYSLFHF
jgi:hypothetical protein